MVPLLFCIFWISVYALASFCLAAQKGQFLQQLINEWFLPHWQSANYEQMAPLCFAEYIPVKLFSVFLTFVDWLPFVPIITMIIIW